MKKLLFFSFCLLFTTLSTEAQIKPVAASPRAILKQTVGLTDIEINYSRPSAKGRSVFGRLIPFGKIWRTGANENTTISFSDDVVIAGKTLKKGKYALFSIPRIENWDVIFYSKTDNWGVPEPLEEASIALKATVPAEALSRATETLTIEINNIQASAATLDIYWENSMLSLKIELPTQKKMLESIDKALAGPTSEDYYNSAQFLFQSNVDISKALEYINKSVAMNPAAPFYYNRLKSLIQANLGDKKGAIATARISLEAAQVAKNQEYVKMNQESIDEWSRK